MSILRLFLLLVLVGFVSTGCATTKDYGVGGDILTEVERFVFVYSVTQDKVKYDEEVRAGF